MDIDLDKLSRAQLVKLNHKITQRLRFLDQMKQHEHMLRFNLGDKVCFEDKYGDTQIGSLVKYNKKTVSIITDEGERWNVSPTLLSPLKDADIAAEQTNIIEFKKAKNA